MNNIIYESPDKGNTIYARVMGEKTRIFVKGGGGSNDQFNDLSHLGRKYQDILKTAETNPALKKAVEEMELIYGLTKKY